jgi:hypothetical protein
VKDRYGKKHRIYSVMVNDRMTVIRFLENYNLEAIDFYFMRPLYEDDGVTIERDTDGNIIYDDEPIDDFMEIVELALDKRETREQINKWIDRDLIYEIIMKFTKMSEYKKKVMLAKMEQSNGDV